MIRLQKYLADCGLASRRKCEEIIQSGRVTVNGKTVAQLGVKVDENKDIIAVDGKQVKPVRTNIYYILNKPEKVMSTAHDPEGRPTVVSLIKSDIRLYPVGRLDYNTGGLILLTNDGELAYRLTHPKYEIEKEYIVVIKGNIDRLEILTLQNGVEIDGQRTAPCKVKVMGKTENTTTLSIIIHEGRNRQVRKMMEAVGKQVLKLTRIRMGELTLGNLKPGQYRRLSDREMAYINKLTK